MSLIEDRANKVRSIMDLLGEYIEYVEHFENECGYTDNLVRKAQNEISEIISEIEEELNMKEEMSRGDVLLENAITLIADKTLESYDSVDEWKEALLTDLGTTEEELKSHGIEFEF